MKKRKGRRHIVIPDVQMKPGLGTDHLKAAGNYIAEHSPDTVICLGDFADMPSLNTYDEKGSLKTEGRRYTDDIKAANHGIEVLTQTMKPKKISRMVLTLGNHEYRITREIERNPKMKGQISLDHLDYKLFGWEVYPFLHPVNIDGVLYSHYFPSGVMGRPITKASRLIATYHQSCIAGHQQGRDIAYSRRADGKTITSIIIGSFYEHKEDYLTPITNNHWRGIYVLNEVHGGEFDEMAVSLNYLKSAYL